MSEPKPIKGPSHETRERIRLIAERKLTLEEFNAYVNAPMSDEERNDILASISWFKRRYPTPADRLAAARKAAAQWSLGMPR